jgi:hypothetical protein
MPPTSFLSALGHNLILAWLRLLLRAYFDKGYRVSKTALVNGPPR